MLPGTSTHWDRMEDTNHQNYTTMKSLPIVCLLFCMHNPLQAQTTESPEEQFIRVNADASNKVTDNSIVYFYTVDELQLGTIVIPMHTRFPARVNLVGGRAFLKVSSIKIHDEVYNVDWRIVGSDYKEGLPIIEADRSFEVYENQRLTFKAFFNRF
jgi:hypothetical protein